jgi:hypothetical protein
MRSADILFSISSETVHIDGGKNGCNHRWQSKLRHFNRSTRKRLISFANRKVLKKLDHIVEANLDLTFTFWRLLLIGLWTSSLSFLVASKKGN